MGRCMAISTDYGHSRLGYSQFRTYYMHNVSSVINSLFQKQLSEKDLASILDRLQEQGTIAIGDSKVTYALPSNNGSRKDLVADGSP